MYIAKGPFQLIHQERALSQVVKARIYNQASHQDLEQWYLAILNLENYMAKLKLNEEIALMNQRRVS